jgi:hypothetical protein
VGLRREGVLVDLGRLMQIRYAIAGSPVSHSLSPLLIEITAAHLRRANLDIEFNEYSLLDCSDVSVPMAWALTEKSRSHPSIASRLFGNPTLSQNHGRLQSAVHGVMSDVIAATPDLIPHGETLFHHGEERLKRRRGQSEAWISLTSPLKHQLNLRSGITCTDDGLHNGAVNQLRWDGSNWHCVSTDGVGLVAVARHFGFDFTLDGVDAPLLCMKGGGGAARSSAAAWARAGGKIWSLGGRRSLDNRGPWVDALIEPESVIDYTGPRLHIDFDLNPSDSSRDYPFGADIYLSSTYDSMDVGMVIEPTETGMRLDGRWLLVAQHLDAWARLYSPEAAHLLPGLGLSMSRLLAVETALRM